MLKVGISPQKIRDYAFSAGFSGEYFPIRICRVFFVGNDGLTRTLGFDVALTKPEALFATVVVVSLTGILFAFANSALEAGPPVRGEIRNCVYRGKNTLRRCEVTIDRHTTIFALALSGRTGDLVTVVKMRPRICCGTYYTVVPPY
jgi:hypothetical protein